MSKNNHTKSFDALSEEERGRRFLKFFNLRKGGQFHCLVKGCGEMFFVGSPALTNHFKEEYNKKEGGENDMSKKPNSNGWTYDEVEAVLLAVNNNLTEGQVRARIDGKRSSNAIKGTLSKFYNWQEKRMLDDISQPLQKFFALFVKNNANSVPTRPEITVQVVTETKEEVKEEEEVLETATTFENLNQWFKDGGPIIMAHVKALVAEEVEQVKTESIRRLKEQQTELDRLREIEKKYNIIKKALA